ncbi:MAG: hypothetical protein ABIR11_03720 [Candidatus Limnocylindrales bacterium]
MVQRIALLAASLTTALVLAAGLALAGLAPGIPVPAAADQPVATTADAGSPAPAIQVDTIYVTPTGAPVEVTVHKVVTAARQGDDGEQGEND